MDNTLLQYIYAYTKRFNGGIDKWITHEEIYPWTGKQNIISVSKQGYVFPKKHVQLNIFYDIGHSNIRKLTHFR